MGIQSITQKLNMLGNFFLLVTHYLTYPSTIDKLNSAESTSTKRHFLLLFLIQLCLETDTVAGPDIDNNNQLLMMQSLEKSSFYF